MIKANNKLKETTTILSPSNTQLEIGTNEIISSNGLNSQPSSLKLLHAEENDYSSHMITLQKVKIRPSTVMDSTRGST